MKIYIIENGYLQETGLIFWCDKKAFKSKKDYLHYIKNSFEVNKGYNYKAIDDFFDSNQRLINYNCLSTDNNEIKVFLKITTLKTYY